MLHTFLWASTEATEAIEMTVEELIFLTMVSACVDGFYFLWAAKRRKVTVLNVLSPHSCMRRHVN